VVLTILPAIRRSPGETGGPETIAPLDSTMEYRSSELAADRIIHMMGTLAGAVGSAILVGIAAAVAVLPTFSASLVYSFCLVAMLGCSAAYNLASNTSRREFLRQVDHAAIFLMIAGTYTPFTTCRLHGVWGIGMTTAVWTGAVTGAVMKLTCPRRIEGRCRLRNAREALWGTVSGARRLHSSTESVGTRKNTITGSPDPKHISTSYAECHNVTMRVSMRWFARAGGADNCNPHVLDP
jgi:hypothetical protein